MTGLPCAAAGMNEGFFHRFGMRSCPVSAVADSFFIVFFPGGKSMKWVVCAAVLAVLLMFAAAALFGTLLDDMDTD